MSTTCTHSSLRGTSASVRQTDILLRFFSFFLFFFLLIKLFMPFFFCSFCQLLCQGFVFPQIFVDNDMMLWNNCGANYWSWKAPHFSYWGVGSIRGRGEINTHRVSVTGEVYDLLGQYYSSVCKSCLSRRPDVSLYSFIYQQVTTSLLHGDSNRGSGRQHTPTGCH